MLFRQGTDLLIQHRVISMRKSVNTIQNCASLKYLTASGESLTEQSCNGSSSQQWQFTYSGGYYDIGLSASPFSNAPIYVSSTYPTSWVVCQLTDGKVKLCSRVNPQYVITRKVASNGAVSIVMEKYSGLNSQHWRITAY